MPSLDAEMSMHNHKTLDEIKKQKRTNFATLRTKQIVQYEENSLQKALFIKLL